MHYIAFIARDNFVPRTRRRKRERERPKTIITHTSFERELRASIVARARARSDFSRINIIKRYIYFGILSHLSEISAISRSALSIDFLLFSGGDGRATFCFVSPARKRSLQTSSGELCGGSARIKRRYRFQFYVESARTRARSSRFQSSRFESLIKTIGVGAPTPRGCVCIYTIPADSAGISRRESQLSRQ